MTLFSRRAVGGLAAVAGFVLAMSAPSLAQSQNHQEGMTPDTQQFNRYVRVVITSSSVMARRSRTRRIPIRSISMISPSSETSTTRATSWQRHLARPSARSACPLGRSTRASSIELTRPPSEQDSSTSRKQLT